MLSTSSSVGDVASSRRSATAAKPRLRASSNADGSLWCLRPPVHPGGHATHQHVDRSIQPDHERGARHGSTAPVVLDDRRGRAYDRVILRLERIEEDAGLELVQCCDALFGGDDRPRRTRACFELCVRVVEGPPESRRQRRARSGLAGAHHPQ
jgi:hypothetical protein